MFNRMQRRVSLAMAVLACLSMAAAAARAEGESKPEDKVYVARSGKSYHKKDCKAISKSKGVVEMTRAEAEKKGAKACKVCKP